MSKPDPHKAAPPTPSPREAQLAEALRRNLRRRKAAAAACSAAPGPGETLAE